jgi:hypothetical protein
MTLSINILIERVYLALDSSRMADGQQEHQY